MTIYLDDIELPDLTIEDEFAFTGIGAETDLALDGTPLVSERARAGRPVDLVGSDQTGWIKRSVLKSIHTLAGAANAVYTLNYEGEISSVRFRNEEPPAVDAVPVVARPNPSDNDYYKNVRIKLMEVDP